MAASVGSAVITLSELITEQPIQAKPDTPVFALLTTTGNSGLLKRYESLHSKYFSQNCF